ncbi:hypothetical protein [Caloramator sp. Dgby_cultured_2]|nr:hypothetical protein [Caloramator sp. Dgby_cultured_2]WDU82804.1 hypothetical protein PWK10_15030 [Caloramator sp. Dgby_cultured_2]
MKRLGDRIFGFSITTLIFLLLTLFISSNLIFKNICNQFKKKLEIF